MSRLFIYFPSFLQQVLLSLPLIQTLCPFLTPICMSSCNSVWIEKTNKPQNNSYNFFCVYQTETVQKNQIAFLICTTIVMENANKNLRKQNLCEMVGGETWANRNCRQSWSGVNFDWTPSERQFIDWNLNTLNKIILFHSWHIADLFLLMFFNKVGPKIIINNVNSCKLTITVSKMWTSIPWLDMEGWQNPNYNLIQSQTVYYKCNVHEVLKDV